MSGLQSAVPVWGAVGSRGLGLEVWAETCSKASRLSTQITCRGGGGGEREGEDERMRGRGGEGEGEREKEREREREERK
eukprot:1099449-Rhodomonas_salina.1